MRKEDTIREDLIKQEIIKEDLFKGTEVGSIAEEPLQPEEQKREVNKERCLSCNRKLKLLGIECKCGDFFCNRHRLPEEHNCPFNHKDVGKQELIKKVLKVEKGKISAI